MCLKSDTPKSFGFSSSWFFSSQDWFQLYMLWNMLQSSGILGEIDWFVFRGVNRGLKSVWLRWMGQSSLIFTVTFLVTDVLLLLASGSSVLFSFATLWKRWWRWRLPWLWSETKNVLLDSRHNWSSWSVESESFRSQSGLKRDQSAWTGQWKGKSENCGSALP